MIKLATLSVMFSLLFSTAVMAADHTSQKSIQDINITETGRIIFHTRTNVYEGEFIQHCPVKKYIDKTINSESDNLGLYAHGARIREGTRISFLDAGSRNKSMGSCKIESLVLLG